jgi:asparagine synthase (glutamine-hydrolysing)
MSAIAGILHLDDEPINLEHGRRMMKDLEKYPADDVQIWHSDKVFLGCHGQWITPESVGEKLPYYDRNRKLAITADAIIDNRDELFEKLQIKKEKRKSITDSELILLSYEKWEQDAPKYLVGDFAFMIWDERKQKLFGARDFSGSRTIYYHVDNKRLVFSTVIHPLFSMPNIEKKLNEKWLAEFLTIVGMIDVVSADQTVYKSIFQLPPSHSITVERGNVRLTQYCTLTSENVLKLKSNEDYVEAFKEVYGKAVRSRLRTHKQVGAQLSGGLDSGSIVSFASNYLRDGGKQLHTYSYIPPKDFEDFTPKHLMPNETPFINAIVQHVGNIKGNFVDFEGRDPFSEIDDFLEVMEMPYKFFENSFWLKGMFEEAQRDNVGILLNGGRGNLTISWGAAIDYYAILLKTLRWRKLVQELHQYSQNVGGSRYRLLPLISREAFPILNKFSSLDTSYQFPLLVNPDFAQRTAVFKTLRKSGIGESGWFESPNIYEQRRRHFEDVFHWNASNTLATKLSLRYSLWKRDPTNDIRVVRFCLSIPEGQYVQNGMDRALVRRATEKLLPDQVRLNQRIRGVQGADWVHRMAPHWKSFEGELSVMQKDERLMAFFNGGALDKALSKVREGVQPEYAIDPDMKILMRSLIVYRFINKFT